jgi:hypothetical protein
MFQSLLFAVDGLIVCYLTFLVKKDRQAGEDANRKLRSANEDLTNSEERFRLTLDEAPIGMALVGRMEGSFASIALYVRWWDTFSAN